MHRFQIILPGAVLVRTCLLVITCVLTLTCGCGGEKKQGENGILELTDDMNRRVSFDRLPSRIVSLAPSLTETMYMLEADTLLVGVTSFCDYPSEAKRKQNVGDLLSPDIEKILALRPDLVLISVKGNTRQTFDMLINVGLTVFVSSPENFNGIFKSINDISILTGTKRRASVFLDSARGLVDLALASQKEERPSMLMLISAEPLIAAGRESFIHELMVTAGAVNAGAGGKGSYPVFDREEILRLNPDVLLLPDDLDYSIARLLELFPEWEQLQAVRGGDVIRVESDIFFRPGPRVVEGLLLLQRLAQKNPEAGEKKRRP